MTMILLLNVLSQAAPKSGEQQTIENFGAVLSAALGGDIWAFALVAFAFIVIKWAGSVIGADLVDE